MSSYLPRALMLGLYVTASLAAQAADTVTLTSRASTVAAVCQEFSQQTGVSYRATGRIANLLLIIDVTDMPADQFAAKLAEVTRGEWRKSGDDFILNRSQSDDNKIKAESQAKLAAKIQEGLAEKTGEFAKRDWSADSIRKMVDEEVEFRQGIIDSVFNAQNQLPQDAQVEINSNQGSNKAGATIVLEEFMNKVDPVALAQIEPGSRVVFADRPNRMQRAMPVNLAPSIARYLQILQQISRFGSGTGLPKNVRFAGGFELGVQPPSRIAKTLASVSRTMDGRNFVIQMILIDPEGKVVSRVSDSLTAATENSESTFDDIKGSFTIDGPSGEFLGVMKDLKNMMGNSNEVNNIAINAGRQLISLSSQDVWKAIPMPASVQSAILTPSRSEPLSFFVSDALIGYSRSQGKNLLAVPDDTLLWSCGDQLLPGENAASKVARLLDERFTTTSEDNLLTILPKDRFDAEMELVSRQSLETVLKRVARQGYGRLEDELDLLKLKDKAPGRNDLALILTRFVDPDLSNRVARSNSIEFAEQRFLGSLPAASRMFSDQPYQVMVGGLGEESRKWLEKVMFGNTSGSLVIGRGMSIGIFTDDGEERPTPPADTTEQFPNGIPVNAVVSLNKELIEALYAANNGQKGRFFTAEALGTYKSLSKQLPNFQGAADFQNFRMADMLAINLTLRLGEDQNELTTANDFAIRDASPVLSWNQISADFRERADAAAERNTGMVIGGRGRVDPPKN